MIACSYWYIATHYSVDTGPDSWGIPDYVGHSSLWLRYGYALYWALMATLGNGGPLIDD